jgi:tetratricopeptide (TPR) repeat protein
MVERNDDLSTSPATLDELIDQARRHSRSYRKHVDEGVTLYTHGRYEQAIVPLATGAELLRDQVLDSRFRSMTEKPKVTKFKAYKISWTISYPTFSGIAALSEREHFTTMMLCVDSLMKLKRFDDACSEIEKGLAITSEVPDVWQVLGIAQHCVGDPEKALDSFREAVRHDPTRLDLWESLRREYLIHDRSEAKLLSEELVKNRSVEDNMALVVDLFIASGEYNKAQSVINDLLQRNRNNKRVLLPLSKLHIINGDFLKAQDSLKNFIKSDKHNLEALWYLACVCAIQGKKKDAVKYLEELLKLNQDHPDGLELQRMLATNATEQVDLLKEKLRQEVAKTTRSEGEKVREIPEEMQKKLSGLMQQVISEIEKEK